MQHHVKLCWSGSSPEGLLQKDQHSLQCYLYPSRKNSGEAAKQSSAPSACPQACSLGQCQAMPLAYRTHRWGVTGLSAFWSLQTFHATAMSPCHTATQPMCYCRHWIRKAKITKKYSLGAQELRRYPRVSKVHFTLHGLGARERLLVRFYLEVEK